MFSWRPPAAAAALLVSLHLGSRPALAKPFPGCRGSTLEGCPGTQNCSVRHFTQQIDHFSWAPPLGGNVSTFEQRYFVNEQWWQPGGAIFFYLGNEDNIELYVNHSGLMWENAPEFGALLVFAEHRYYGESLPFGAGTAGCMSWLTTEQALADFAYLTDHLQESYGRGSRLPVVGFGGSYGGMMAAWFRLKYPQSVDGVIAASAPIWSFVGLEPAYNYNSFYLGVAFDASSAGGASDRCKANLKSAWPRILAAGQSAEGRALLSRSFRTCSEVRPRGEGSDDPYAIVSWASYPWANMAMGNYPYKSTYLMHGASFLPAWPVRTACSHLDADFPDDEALFAAVREAVATQYNNTGDQTCFNVQQIPSKARTMRDLPRASHAPLAQQQLQQQKQHQQQQERQQQQQQQHVSAAADCKGDWDYQWCTEMVQPFTQGTAEDMYYCPDGSFGYLAQNCSDWDFEAAAKNCEATWGVRPRKDWARVGLSSKEIRKMASNMVFSNGLQDPWHGGGVLEDISESVVAVIIKNGAHHIDLMFTDPVDAGYPDIAAARELEVAHMKRWVKEAHKGSQQEGLVI